MFLCGSKTTAQKFSVSENVLSPKQSLSQAANRKKEGYFPICGRDITGLVESDMNSFLQEISSCTKGPVNQQIDRLRKLLDINPVTNRYMKLIYDETIDDTALDNMISNYKFYNDEWLAFNEMVKLFIKLSNQLNPWSVLESFDLYSSFLDSLSTSFSNVRGGCLIMVIRQSINFILPMAIKLDSQFYLKENCGKLRLSWLASILLKVFNNIRSQTNDDNMTKSRIIVFISVKLCMVYFKIDNPLLCRNVFSNINNLQLSMTKFDRNEIIQYRYYLSKFYLIKDQLIDSYQHLSWCLINSPTYSNPPHPNIIRILQLLLPISILIGKTPNFKYIRQIYFNNNPSITPGFINIYENLFKAIKRGNFGQCYQIITNNYDYLKALNILIVLQNKSTILIVRNLFKKVWDYLGNPLSIDYDSLILALNLSHFNVRLDDLIVENLLISLIDQNLLKGKIFPRLRVISLAKTNVFPPVDQINFIRFGNGDEHTLNGNDSWLNN